MKLVAVVGVEVLLGVLVLLVVVSVLAVVLAVVVHGAVVVVIGFCRCSSCGVYILRQARYLLYAS